MCLASIAECRPENPEFANWAVGLFLIQFDRSGWMGLKTRCALRPINYIVPCDPRVLGGVGWHRPRALNIITQCRLFFKDQRVERSAVNTFWKQPGIYGSRYGTSGREMVPHEIPQKISELDLKVISGNEWDFT